jgi:hypothetical protein
MNASERATALLATLILPLALTACGAKISAENYDKIVNGMAEDKVAGILGIASESRNASMTIEGTTFTSTESKWRSDKGTIVVYFQNGEVRDKQYYAPGTEPAPARRN